MVANACLAYPVTFAASSYVLRVVYNSVTEDRTFTVTAGRHYWPVGDGQAGADLGGIEDLFERLRACIASHTGSPTVTVALDANFRLRVSVASNTLQILWSHANTTLDDGIFGFSGDTSDASAVVSQNIPQGLWVPGRPIWSDGRPQRPMVGGVARTLSGVARVSDFGTMARERSIYFGRLPQSVALEEFAATHGAYNSIEYAWLNAIGLGLPFRLYLDDAVANLATGSSAYTLWRTNSKARPFERLGENPPDSLYWSARLSASEVT